MKTYDAIVIGAGSGLIVSSHAAALGLKVALIEDGPMGGTCLNRGCIPSKILIHSAEVVETIKNSEKYGVKSTLTGIDFSKVIKRSTVTVDHDAKKIEKAIKGDEDITLYKTKGKFVGKSIIQVGKEKIKGKKIIIAAGTRPRIPPVKNIESVPYLTSKTALRLKKLPKTLTVIGGGYIAAELAYFYGTMGTKVTVIQRGDVMVTNEDREISEKFTQVFAKNHTVLTGHTAFEVQKKGKKIVTIVGPKSGKGKKKKIVSDQLLVATGRVPNTDTLDLEKTGVKVNKYGYIETNQGMQTSVKNIWAFGDIAGKYFFKHSANLEAQTVVKNALYNGKDKVNYSAMPHAIFSSPQVAGVGETEEQLQKRKANYVIGRYSYMKSGMGLALEDKDGFVKVLADKKTKKILGCHILGTDASSIIHEAILAMRYDINAEKVASFVHIHPALSEVVQRACQRIEW